MLELSTLKRKVFNLFLTMKTSTIHTLTNIYFVFLLYTVFLSINYTYLSMILLSLLALKLHYQPETKYVSNICKNRQFSKIEIFVLVSSIVLIFLNTYQLPSKIPEPLVFILLPILEELVFREYMIKAFNSALGIVVSSVLFAMLHSQSLILFLSSMSMGIILGIIYLRTDRIENTIIIHYIFNFCTLVTKLV